LKGLVWAVAVLHASTAYAQEQEKRDPLGSVVKWQKSGGHGKLGDQAQIYIPPGYRFARAEDTKKLMELMGNPVDGDEMGLIMPDDPKQQWFVVFQFEDCGYVKDEEKGKLDAASILKSLKAGNDEANKERKKMGHPALEIVGWEKPPAFNDQTKNLEWAIRGSSEGDQVINYNVRILGRQGVMSANLVADPDEMTETMPKYRALLGGFGYTSGHRYAEFKPGDKIAKYGLTALITGGAVAVALKTGLFQKLWKLLLVGVVAVGAAIKKLFGRRRAEA